MSIDGELGSASVRETSTLGTAERTDAFSSYTKRDIVRNMSCCIMMDAIFMTGWADMTIAITPLMVFLNASNFQIGIVNGLNWVALLGNIISPFISRRFEYKKKYFFSVNIPYLLPIAIGGLGVLLWHHFGWTKPMLLGFVLGAFVIHWFFAGFVTLPHTEYIAACIPSNLRATLSGMSFSVGSGLGLITTAIGYMVLKHVDKPAAYGYLFLMTWVVIQSGYLIALFAKETRTPVEKSPAPWSRRMFKAFWDDKRYVNFVVIQFLLTTFLSLGTFSFINVYGLKVLHMRVETMAFMGGAMLIARIVFSTPAGMLTDKVGAKRLFPICALLGGVVLLPCILLHSPVGVYMSIALSVLYFAGVNASSAMLNFGLPKPENRSGHFTLQNITFIAASQ